jgi:hypothetical protein
MKIIVVLAIILSAAVVAKAQSDIHAVDFKNFTYPAFCAGAEPEKITIKDGEYSKETQEDGYVDRIWFKVFSVKYGDLNGDKKDEAAVLSICNTGGTGNFTEGYIYAMRSGKPALIARIPGGDRAYGGLREASVENGVLVVERNDAGEDGASCCPQFILTEHYKLAGGKIVEMGKAAKRPLVPTERISFAKGTSGKTFKTTIPAGESKHFIVGAAADKISLLL